MRFLSGQNKKYFLAFCYTSSHFSVTFLWVNSYFGFSPFSSDSNKIRWISFTWNDMFFQIFFGSHFNWQNYPLFYTPFNLWNNAYKNAPRKTQINKQKNREKKKKECRIYPRYIKKRFRVFVVFLNAYLCRSVAHLWAGDILKNDWIMEMYNWIRN